MTAFTIMNIQFSLSLVCFGLIGKWYLFPFLSKKKFGDALIPLLWLHVFRYAPLTLLATGQVDPQIPESVLQTIADGDLMSGLLALLAIVFLRFKFKKARLVVWIANVIGIMDICIALVAGLGAQLFAYALGFNWYILNFYVPMLIVSHVLMVVFLVTKKK